MAYYNNVLYGGFETLVRNGLVEILVFALIFALVYGILENVKLFGTKNTDEKQKALSKKLHAVIALVLAILSIVPHYYVAYSRYDIIPIVTAFLPEISIGVLLILCALILLGLFGFNLDPSKGHPYIFYIFIAIIAYVFWVMGDITRWWNLPRWMNYEMVSVIVAVLVFIGIVKFIMGDDKKYVTKHDDIVNQINKGDFKNIKAKDLLANMFGGYKPPKK